MKIDVSGDTVDLVSGGIWIEGGPRKIHKATIVAEVSGALFARMMSCDCEFCRACREVVNRGVYE